jgi:hypothetical protein
MLPNETLSFVGVCGLGDAGAAWMVGALVAAAALLVGTAEVGAAKAAGALVAIGAGGGGVSTAGGDGAHAVTTSIHTASAQLTHCRTVVT